MTIVINVVIILIFIGLFWQSVLACFSNLSEIKQFSKSIIAYQFKTNLLLSFLFLLSILLFFFGIAVVSQLRWIYLINLLWMFGLGLFLVFFWSLSFIKQYQIFDELVSFLQSLIIHYRIHHSFFGSLKEMHPALGSHLKSRIEKIILCINSGESIESSLHDFSNEFNHFIVINLFRTLLMYETFGQAFEGSSLRIIEQDIDDWIEDVFHFRYSIKRLRNQIILASMLSIFIFIVARNMLTNIIDITASDLYQMLTFSFITLVFIVIMFAFKKLSVPWLSKHEQVSKSWS